jgi:hypothetical protein
VLNNDLQSQDDNFKSRLEEKRRKRLTMLTTVTENANMNSTPQQEDKIEPMKDISEIQIETSGKKDCKIKPNLAIMSSAISYKSSVSLQNSPRMLSSLNKLGNRLDLIDDMFSPLNNTKEKTQSRKDVTMFRVDDVILILYSDYRFKAFRTKT